MVNYATGGTCIGVAGNAEKALKKWSNKRYLLIKFVFTMPTIYYVIYYLTIISINNNYNNFLYKKSTYKYFNKTNIKWAINVKYVHNNILLHKNNKFYQQIQYNQANNFMMYKCQSMIHSLFLTLETVIIT
jgi:hypothetical protein